MEDLSSPSNQDFISLYLQYTSQTECPTFFHRWVGLTCLSAWIGRDIYFPFGHIKIHSNMYVMLVGLAGTKKSTAIKIGTKLLSTAGYTKFAADKTRQEKFLVDLVEDMQVGSLGDSILEQNLFGDTDMSTPAEAFVASDEINNFIGVGNMDFMSILGELWDIDKPYKYKLKNSASVLIPFPTITLLAGNTFVGLNKLFPPEAIEQGFFSRIVFVYGEPTDVKYTIPPNPDIGLRDTLIELLKEIKQKVYGEIMITPGAYSILDKIYKSDRKLDDPRFDAYENRRQQHLLKVCMLVAASRVSKIIDEGCIIEANTLLTFTEQLMPKALGEFGRARNSGVTHKVMSAVDSTLLPISFQTIWKLVHTDLETRIQLADILSNLIAAEKIQVVETGEGYLPIKKVTNSAIDGTVNWNLLTNAERKLA